MKIYFWNDGGWGDKIWGSSISRRGWSGLFDFVVGFCFDLFLE